MNFRIIASLVVLMASALHAQPSALYQAARTGDLAALGSELARGADVNTKTPLGETALIFAVESCQAAAAEMLVKSGAQIEIMTKLGRSPLIIAASKGCMEIVRMLLNAGADVPREDPKRHYNALLKAVEFDRLEVVELLVSRGAKVNYRNIFGMTPLMVASQKGHEDIVEFLLEKKADINAATLTGYTALIFALDFNHPDIAFALMTAGADAKVVDNRNQTALMFAAVQGYDDLVTALIDKGADVNAKNEKGESALALANKKALTEIVSFLIEKGADTTGVQIAIDSTAAVAEGQTAETIAKEEEAPLTPPEPIGGIEGIQKRLRYPKKARDARIEGEITLEVAVTRIAQIKSVKVIKSFNNKECDRAAETAVRNTRWKPAKRGKKNVDGVTTVTLTFKLDQTS